MARPLTEFIQSQLVPWTPARPEWGAEGARAKLLSADAETGAATLLMSYPPGYREVRSVEDDRDEEIFVLRGALDLGDAVAGMHSYAYFPPGADRCRVRPARVRWRSGSSGPGFPAVRRRRP